MAPQFATTYYVRAEGFCNTTNCVAITVINGSIYQTSVAAAIPCAICEDASSLLNAIFTVRTNPAILITEITQNGASVVGQTVPRPSYFGATAEDFVEISNLSNTSINMNGISFELWSGASLNRSYTFSGAVTIPAHGVIVLHIGSGTDSPSDNTIDRVVFLAA